MLVSHHEPPRLISPYPWFFAVEAAAPATVPTDRRPTIAAAKHLDERFVVSWPKSLHEAVPQLVIVRITANNYEDILKDIAGPERRVKTEKFKGTPKLEVTLKADPGIDVVSQHSDQQTVTKGQRYREWTWSVWPKATGQHQLSLLVQSVNATIREDYDPEVMEYEVAFNPWYWLSSGIQQNAIGWVWALVLMVITGIISYLAGKRKRKESDGPTESTDSEK